MSKRPVLLVVALVLLIWGCASTTPESEKSPATIPSWASDAPPTDRNKVAPGDVFYVSSIGDDTNPGTESAPFRTLQHGVGVLDPGDTLYLRNGTYAESLIDNIPGGTSWDAPVTIASFLGERAVIRPSSGLFALHFVAPQRYIVIDGLVVDGRNLDNAAVKITVGSSTGPADHIRLIRTEVMNSPTSSGILVTDDASWNEFVDLNVHDNGDTRLDHGLYISTQHNLVEGSWIHDNAGWGVHVYGEPNAYATKAANDNVVRGNLITGNGMGEGGFGIILSSGTGNVAYNNVLVGNENGIQVAYFDPRRTQVVNNTIYGSGQWGILVGSDARDTLVRNNIVVGSGSSNLEVEPGGPGFVADHNIVGGDAGFVDAANGDFHLIATSPAVDIGAEADFVKTDFDGVPRPQGARWDIGAYERATK